MKKTRFTETQIMAILREADSFRNVQEMRDKTDWWMTGYSEDRLDDVLRDLTPAEYIAHYAENSNLIVSS